MKTPFSLAALLSGSAPLFGGELSFIAVALVLFLGALGFSFISEKEDFAVRPCYRVAPGSSGPACVLADISLNRAKSPDGGRE